ncbi:hypothetical protein ABID22_003624 [Pontibacter aydingkolensis]|uniref:Uncharacterized protein n=1 Tax=Pontibacter aydingkolensis TaxID=1911536 RepID=A0ABS7CYI9_9BACT|nr:hypothetical protein [Pontibacter aydingkolensis]MBW7468923.1 hypothetical protein [Pontibacter aydingkolensis]
MAALPHYKTIASEAFNDYLDNKTDLEGLIERLRYIELQVQSDDEEDEEPDKKVWFRFFEGDTLKTTINELEKELGDPAHPSYRILLYGIATGLEANELEVHYS